MRGQEFEATHIALAFDAIYRRRTLRMPPLEVLRIALGLGIPILLIGHAVNTRVAWEIFRQSPDYSRVVWQLWISDNAIHAAGGVESGVTIDSAFGVFGIGDGLQTACRHALAAAKSIRRALDDLGRRHSAEFGVVADFGIQVHAGQGALDNAPSQAPRRWVGAGDVFDAIEWMRAVRDEGGAPGIVVSAIVLEQTGAALATLRWQPVATPRTGPALNVTILDANA